MQHVAFKVYFLSLSIMHFGLTPVVAVSIPCTFLLLRILPLYACISLPITKLRCIFLFLVCVGHHVSPMRDRGFSPIAPHKIKPYSLERQGRIIQVKMYTFQQLLLFPSEDWATRKPFQISQPVPDLSSDHWLDVWKRSCHRLRMSFLSAVQRDSVFSHSRDC